MQLFFAARPKRLASKDCIDALHNLHSRTCINANSGARVQAKYVRTLVGLSREAPSMFMAAGHYFLFTSGCTGWEPNRAEVFYATCASASVCV